MSKQRPPAPTANAVGPCPTLIQISRTPRHCKFTQPHRTTRPPLILSHFVLKYVFEDNSLTDYFFQCDLPLGACLMQG